MELLGGRKKEKNERKRKPKIIRYAMQILLKVSLTSKMFPTYHVISWVPACTNPPETAGSILHDMVTSALCWRKRSFILIKSQRYKWTSLRSMARNTTSSQQPCFLMLWDLFLPGVHFPFFGEWLELLLLWESPRSSCPVQVDTSLPEGWSHILPSLPPWLAQSGRVARSDLARRIEAPFFQGSCWTDRL